MVFSNNTYTILFALFGVVVLFFFLLETLWGLMQLIRSLLAPFLMANEETSLIKKYGSWALITGSTDGIGKAYAHELAKRGINVVLVSRSEEKLRNTAKEIESKHGVKTKIIVADFSLGRKAVEIVREELGKLPIGILVNNVGKMYDYPMYLTEVDEKDLEDIITINVGSVTYMCRAFLEDMKKQGRGAIVNISSGSELQPLPLMTTYAATKAYIRHFTLALRYEYSKYNLTIQNISPLFTKTKMNQFCDKLQEVGIFNPDPETYARYAVAILGRQDNSTGYWAHGIQYFFMQFVPEWVRTYIGGEVNKGFRRDYLKKHKIEN